MTPEGDLIATEHRGTMYGNRGILHNDDLVIVRRHQVRRWLVCVLEFRGRRRRIMQPHRYTELFFLDEAVALAAGHRPCAECRYPEYQQFRAAWAHSGPKPTADEIDNVLHTERGLINGARTTHQAAPDTLPDGVFIRHKEANWLLHNRKLRLWTPAGYTESRTLADGPADVLTPVSTVDTIRAGYRPGVHPSANV
ncbi:hypothetical protein [Actinocrispum wychmicini]|uniref:hypothetical protein n=1 Tax=Actinocrispum wychmicini TaxID=1213861 RepID=UPI001A9E00AF|nr:hypothetical protein [Actinocrispum wychmicini]